VKYEQGYELACRHELKFVEVSAKVSAQSISRGIFWPSSGADPHERSGHNASAPTSAPASASTSEPASAQASAPASVPATSATQSSPTHTRAGELGLLSIMERAGVLDDGGGGATVSSKVNPRLVAAVAFCEQENVKDVKELVKFDMVDQFIARIKSSCPKKHPLGIATEGRLLAEFRDLGDWEMRMQNMADWVTGLARDIATTGKKRMQSEVRTFSAEREPAAGGDNDGAATSAGEES
jgi:hypothetical protein